MDLSSTRITRSRPLKDYAKVQFALGALLRGRRFQARRALGSGRRLLNIGCGPNIRPEFINLDWQWRPGIDVCWDLKDGLPFPDAAFDGIYSEHCLEHLPLELARRTLAECHRTLAKGGRIRLIVPDAELYFDLYHRWKSESPDFPFLPADRVRAGELTPLMAINQSLYGHGHLFSYDFDTLRTLLAAAGFSAVEHRRFGEGTPALLLDQIARRPESLYVEAVK